MTVPVGYVHLQTLRRMFRAQVNGDLATWFCLPKSFQLEDMVRWNDRDKRAWGLHYG